MDNWVLDQVERWHDDAFDGGIDGLHRLSENAFSGALITDDLQLLLVNGRVVGISGGDLAELNGNGTTYMAPDPGVALLFAMRDESEEINRGFTDDTSFLEVHESLLSRNFSGFLRLSEYVLSGDYYVVYHGGKAIPVAFVGASERLHTGDDVLALADDEVGIYEVHRAPVTIEPVPDPI